MTDDEKAKVTIEEWGKSVNDGTFTLDPYNVVSDSPERVISGLLVAVGVLSQRVGVLSERITVLNQRISLLREQKKGPKRGL